MGGQRVELSRRFLFSGTQLVGSGKPLALPAQPPANKRPHCSVHASAVCSPLVRPVSSWGSLTGVPQGSAPVATGGPHASTEAPRDFWSFVQQVVKWMFAVMEDIVTTLSFRQNLGGRLIDGGQAQLAEHEKETSSDEQGAEEEARRS